MNKLFYLLFLFLFIYVSSNAQTEVGMKFGLNISNVYTSNDDGTTTLSSYNTGIVVRFKVKDNLLLNTEALLSNKGFNVTLFVPNGNIEHEKYLLPYLSFPVLLNYYPANKIYFQTGPEFNFLISNKNLTEQYRMFDFSLAGGLGFEILKKLTLETRYVFGLSQIRKDEDIYGSYKNWTLQINLIYLLKQKR